MMKRIAPIALYAIFAFAFYSLGEWLAESSSRYRSAEEAPLPERVSAALEETDSVVRAIELTRALEQARTEDFPELAAAYEARFDLVPPRRSSVELLGDAWGALDPEAAIARMSEWPDETRLAGVSAVMNAWARHAPVQAVTWAQSLELDDRAAAMNGAFQGWAASGRPGIWDFLATLEMGFERESALNIVMKSVVQNGGFDELFEQVDEIQTEFEPGSPRDFKLSALRTAIGLCAYYDPDRALEFALHYAGGPYDNGLLRRVAIFWVINEGSRAMDTFIALPTGPQRDKALRDGYRKWLRTDGAAALDWVSEESVNDERYAPLLDIYPLALAMRKSADQLEPINEAASWIDLIEDSELRRHTSVLLGVFWLRHDSESAQSWIDERGIADEVEVERVRQLAAQKAGEIATAKTRARANPGEGRN
jgi:hypothetical protein